MSAQPAPTHRIPTFHDFVPNWLRFGLLMVFIAISQFTNAVYLGNLHEVMGARQFYQEDVLWIWQASFIGMTVAFPLVFRFKFRFTARQLLLGLEVGCAHLDSVPLLVAVSLLMGFIKMLVAFECLFAVQPIITPTRDMALFFLFFYTLLLGLAQAAGWLMVQVADVFTFESVYDALAGLLLVQVLLILTCMREVRLTKLLPLYGIDWWGLLLWTALFLAISYVCFYGQVEDWLDSARIQAALVALPVLGLALAKRTFATKRAFILPVVYRYGNVLLSVGIVLVLQLFLGSSGPVLGAFTAAHMHLDPLHSVGLNQWVLTGILLGAACSYYWLVRRRGGFPPIFFAGFASLTLYYGVMYFTFYPGAGVQDLALPYTLQGLGTSIIYIAVAAYMVQGVAQPHFPMCLMLVNITHNAIGGPLATSLFANWEHHLLAHHQAIAVEAGTALHSQTAGVFQHLVRQALHQGHNPAAAQQLATAALHGHATLDAMLWTFKEIFGTMIYVGLAVLLAMLLWHFQRQVRAYLPAGPPRQRPDSPAALAAD